MCVDQSYNVQVITIGSERFRCPEVLFTPSLVDIQAPGIADMVVNSIKKCNAAIRKELFGNVVLSGGTTMLSGIADRLYKDISDRAPYSMRVQYLLCGNVHLALMSSPVSL